MKTKLYAKKTLSVFMAVMMLMSAWVFVAPEKASAYPDSASIVSAENRTALNSIPSFNTDVTTTINVHWLDGLNPTADRDNDSVKAELYKNVLYSSSNIGSSATASTGSVNLKDSSAATINWYHGATTFLYDGVTTPQTGIIVNVVPKGTSYNVRTYSSYISNSGFSMGMTYWYAEDGRANYTYIMGAPNANNAATTNGTRSDSYCWTVNESKFYANTVQFTGSMSDSTFYKEYSPTWVWVGNQKSQGTGSYYTYSATSGNKFVVINYVPLKAALNEALGTGTYSISTLKNNAAKYTTTSVAEYVAAVKDLINAKPNNYVNSSSNNYTGYANAASAAVTRFNNAKANLTLQTYRISFEDKDGNIGNNYYSRDYGTTVNLAELAANHSNTLGKGNENGHQTYTWGNLATSHVVIDDVIIKETPSSQVAHTYGDWTQNADNHSRTCSVCGYVQTQDHIEGTGYQTKAETCTEDGVMTYDCSVCGKKAIETSVINEITGHDFTGAIVENVTGENGNHWRKCARCDAYGWAGIENGFEKHNWIVNETVPAKCEENGSTTYKCTVCDSTSYVITHTATGHNNIGHKDAKNVANSCEEKGWPEFWVCKDCGKIWLDAEKTNEIADVTDSDGNGIPDSIEIVNAHKFEGNYVSKTSGENGEHYRLCTVCGTAKGLDGVVDKAEPHAWGEPAIENSTCTSEGKKTYKCELCPQTYIETIAKAEHSMTKTDANAPSCTAPGNNEYYYCSTCTTYYKDAQGTSETTVEAEKLNKLTHTWTAHHEYDTLVSKATCTAVAVYNNHCDYCKEQIIGESHEYGTTDTVNGHNFTGEIKKNDDGTHSYACINGCGEYGNATTCEFTVLVEDVASTCHTYGYTITRCATCDKENRVEKTELDLDNHDGGTEVREVIAATCAANGFTGNTYCLGCKAKIANGETIPADKTKYPHEDMKIYDAKPSTCQTEGWKEYKYCSACGTYEIAKETIAKKAHKFTTYNSNGDGTHTATCDTCDAAVATPVTDTKDCSGGTANCVEEAVCAVCKTAYGTVNADNHKTVVRKDGVPATCQTEGTEPYNYCEACNKATEEIEKIGKLDHKYSAWSKVDGEDKHTRSCTTCDEAVAAVAVQTEDCSGGIAYCNALAKCATCKAEYGELNANNHGTQSNHLEGAKEATCQAPGFTGDRLYDCCNALKEAGTVISQKEHTFDIEVENSRVAATCIKKGEVTYKCSTCVETDDVKAATQKKELDIDINNHASAETKIVNKKEPTCETDGHTGDIYYACCYDSEKTAEENRKALKEKGTIIKANGQHVYGDAVPEYMIKEIKETKDENGKVTKREFVLNAEPDYDAKVEARRDDDKWYHARICTICNEVAYTACYTYEHTYSCVDTDKCEICEGLCSLKDPDKHTNLVEIPQVDATHTADGTRAYYKCADCGKFFLDDAGKKGFDPTSEEGKKLITISKDTVPCTDWVEDKEAYVAPTCGQDGYKVYKCTTEGCTKTKKEPVPATSDSHEWSEEYREIKAPTCGAVGYEELYCTKCDVSKPNSTVTIAATGEHDYKLVKSVTGSSCIDPTTEYYECNVCGAEKTKTVYDGAAAHSWGEWKVVGGDCSTGVVLEQECEVCHTKQQKTDSTEAHQFELLIRVEPTPESDGYETLKCKNCGEEKTEVLKYTTEEPDEPEDPEDPEDPDADKHVYDETQYRVVEEQSCASAEIREYTCVRCGEKIRKAVGSPSEHTWLKQVEEKATCERDGHSEYYRCVRCLAEYGEGKIVYEATGHADNNKDGKCDSCGSMYYDNGTKVCNCMCHSTGFMGFIYKIVRFFWKLFKMNPNCGCGVAHY